MGFKTTTPSGISHQGLDAPLAHRKLDIPCEVASPQSLFPFLQAAPAYLRGRTIDKYHWTPDLCLENPGPKARAPFSRMNLIFHCSFAR